jgi:hypothetical protein
MAGRRGDHRPAKAAHGLDRRLELAAVEHSVDLAGDSGAGAPKVLRLRAAAGPAPGRRGMKDERAAHPVVVHTPSA